MKRTIKRWLYRQYSLMILFGIDPLKLIRGLRNLRFYLKDYAQIKKQKGNDSAFYFGRIFPILDERFAEAGVMSGHYFHQDLYIARKIYERNPEQHIDIGSRTDGFVAHVAVFREITVMDIRVQPARIKNIKFRKADLMQLPDDLINTCDSISSLHAIEHFGLGRYGDPIDYDGHLRAIQNIAAMLKVGGRFYFSVPIGEQRIEFNAHRIFSMEYLIALLEDYFTIEGFSYVDDQGNFFERVELGEEAILNNFSCRHGCGIFELVKM